MRINRTVDRLWRGIAALVLLKLSTGLVFPATAADFALSFNGSGGHVTFGAAPGLGSPAFTIETWFKRSGHGVAANTGSGGTTAIPLVSKGRGEADGSNLDMNYFLGIRTNGNVLVADFEEGASGSTPGLNHPVSGVTPIVNGVWYHAAATYDGTKWQLFLNGSLEAELAVGQPPRADSIQHAAAATTMNSVGTPVGFFQGVLDEIRIWNFARTQQQVAGAMNQEITSAAGLLGRWGLNEGAGAVAGNSVGGGVNGSLVNSPTWVAGFTQTGITAVVTRGPYLQLGTPTAVVVRWRTDLATDSRVRFGTSAANLNLVADVAAPTTEHEVALSGLTPNTRYYYSVGTASGALAGGSDFNFVTAPPVGQSKPTRIWVLGDSGSADANAAAVRNAYTAFTGSRDTDLWLMLGDNAYDTGTDANYQGAVFNMYPTYLRRSVLWPTIGNHDTAQSPNPPADLPYFRMFTLPVNGEAGGVASGTEKYYSFDYGDIHFICLDSMSSDRSTNGAMHAWLDADLASTVQDWIIAYWHHPPYSKGSHDSDLEGELVQMRQNFLPMLEAAGVDLVLAGHSHSYERSYLLNGHYGLSTTLSAAMVLNGGSGRENGTGAYTKPPGLPAHKGAVYAVAGSSGKISGGALNHPVMYISLNNLGSMVLDVTSNRLDARFLRETGATGDYFTIIKAAPQSPPAAPANLVATAVSRRQINLTWADLSGNESGFVIERSLNGADFAQIAQTAANVTSFADTGVTRNKLYYYRLRAFNAAGTSPYSNTASAKTPKRRRRLAR